MPTRQRGASRPEPEATRRRGTIERRRRGSGRADRLRSAFRAIYLLAHSLAKVILVAALLKEPAAGLSLDDRVSGGLHRYQLYPTEHAAIGGLTALTIFDAFIAWLTYRDYHKQLAVARR